MSGIVKQIFRNWEYENIVWSFNEDCVIGIDEVDKLQERLSSYVDKLESQLQAEKEKNEMLENALKPEVIFDYLFANCGYLEGTICDQLGEALVVYYDKLLKKQQEINEK